MKQKKYFLLALIFALLAAGSVYLFLQNLEEDMKRDSDYTNVIVATEQIPVRTKITADMIDSKAIPSSQVHGSALLNSQAVIGSTTNVPLFPGEQIISQKLVSPGETSNSLSYSITPGKRAMAIAVNEVVGVGNMVLPGDNVDVLALVGVEDENRNSTTYASLIIQDIRVLAVNQILHTEQTSIAGNTVTLEVSPQEAQELALATESGNIRLLLRSATETDDASIQPSRVSDLIK